MEESTFVQVTMQTTYVDLVLDQTLPRDVQNELPLRDLQMRNRSESTSVTKPGRCAHACARKHSVKGGRGCVRQKRVHPRGVESGRLGAVASEEEEVGNKQGTPLVNPINDIPAKSKRDDSIPQLVLCVPLSTLHWSTRLLSTSQPWAMCLQETMTYRHGWCWHGQHWRVCHGGG
jgi:hypothetical protein